MISVITPVYNGEDFIIETVESVLNAAAHHDVEYIIVNDGSDDQTLERIQKFESRVKILSKENGGESSAVNMGLAEAKGDLVLIVSADDPLPSDDIFVGAESFFSKNLGVVAWYPNWKIIDAEGKELRTVEVDDYSDELLIGRFRCLPGPGTLFRRTAALSIGGRNDKWVFVGDYDFWLRLSRVGRIQKRNQLVAQWRFHDQSTSIARRGTEMASERIAVIEEFIEFNPIEQNLVRQAIAHSYYYAARLSFFDTRVKGKKYLSKALKVSKGRIKDGKITVYLFIALLPLSKHLVSIVKPFLRKFGRALT
jgi:glycosyltransferase involved in cell wall biosynthesis